jgi:hypothetical protein
MSGPSNIKIQKTGAVEVGNAQVRSPASDLERSKDRAFVEYGLMNHVSSDLLLSTERLREI